ncbi:MAG: dephospho-CoA kinase [Pseudomonadota bacterium]
MIILGLTGSLAMGKSNVARHFRARGVPVHDADAAVHKLYEGAAVAPIREAFPGAIVDSKVDRKKLSALLSGKEQWQKLEAIVHPLVRQEKEKFLQAAQDKGMRLVVVDIPLLFETGGDKDCHAVLVVTAPFEMQKQRAMKRAGMTEEKFNAIVAQQMPDAEKKRRAHFIIDTSGPKSATARQVDAIIRAYSGR